MHLHLRTICNRMYALKRHPQKNPKQTKQKTVTMPCVFNVTKVSYNGTPW